MKEYIEREAVIKYLEKYADGYSYIETPTESAIADIKAIPAADVVEVVRCLECKHRPTKPEKYIDGFDLAFPDEACPCYCDDDPFYSWYPSDDWFCPKGERKGGDE